MDLYYRHSLPSGSGTDTAEDEESEMTSTQPPGNEYPKSQQMDGLHILSDNPVLSKFCALDLYPCNRSEIECLLMDFYVNTIQQDKVYFLLDQGQNPVSFMLMSACTSPTIYVSILMFAANRLAQLDSKFSHVVMRYRHRTLKALRDLLIQRDGSIRDILLVSMMLCTVEVSYLVIVQFCSFLSPSSFFNVTFGGLTLH